MNREPMKVIADILCHELSIAPNRVYMMNDVRPYPNDDNLFVVMNIEDSPPYGSQTKYQETQDGLIQKQTLNIKEKITISLVSKSTEARLKRFGVEMAINSTYSQQAQEQYGFHIAKLAKVVDRSFLEKTARLTRFDTEVTVIYAEEQTSSVDFYQIFETAPKFEG